ncbi:ATP-grasp domain-containing protein [Desulfonatronovibrio hydrogenovorans]|uniref:ATP-grasp domain-containing protein n=1 Tax=Desulfonatronovibrio hydrogenovorans TaxID=53245 RepID=UPI00048F0C0F|nr:ATP-grasp domain-containing protein [Desulfonatronovibrio hydrogenovorans]
MFFVDKPYISDFFKETLKDHQIPVVGTKAAKELDLLPGTNIVDEKEAVEMARKSNGLPVYSSSENSLGWISKYLHETSLPRQISQFKDKLGFRELTRHLFPDFYFQGVTAEDLKDFKTEELCVPCIIKPALGFFSMGVHRVDDRQQWQETLAAIQAEMKMVQGIYPREVMDADRFVIEQCILGEEFAVDAYYDFSGEPVILSIFKHIFSSDADVSDRVYTTSKDIIQNNLREFTEFASKIGKAAGVKNFPVHMELRRQQDGQILPIEINPLRFGGWCTTPDMTCKAWGFNPYLYYYEQKRPDWDSALQDKDGKLFSIIVLDNSTGIDGKNITSFNYDQVLAGFEKPLELRKIDYRCYPVFGFLFAETREENFHELEYILNSDLKEFSETKTG